MASISPYSGQIFGGIRGGRKFLFAAVVAVTCVSFLCLGGLRVAEAVASDEEGGATGDADKDVSTGAPSPSSLEDIIAAEQAATDEEGEERRSEDRASSLLRQIRVEMAKAKKKRKRTIITSVAGGALAVGLAAALLVYGIRRLKTKNPDFDQVHLTAEQSNFGDSDEVTSDSDTD